MAAYLERQGHVDAHQHQRDLVGWDHATLCGVVRLERNLGLATQLFPFINVVDGGIRPKQNCVV